jgi:hypothetical protein
MSISEVYGEFSKFSGCVRAASANVSQGVVKPSLHTQWRSSLNSPRYAKMTHTFQELT